MRFLFVAKVDAWCRRGVRAFETRPVKGQKKMRLAVSMQKWKLCYIPVTAAESNEQAPERSGSETRVPPQSTGSS